jgi:hypothetical protein
MYEASFVPVTFHGYLLCADIFGGVVERSETDKVLVDVNVVVLDPRFPVLGWGEQYRRSQCAVSIVVVHVRYQRSDSNMGPVVAVKGRDEACLGEVGRDVLDPPGHGTTRHHLGFPTEP